MNLPENYQNLVNAIIMQAVKDYRKSKKYLQDHPMPRDLETIVAVQIKRRENRREKRLAKGLPPGVEKRSQEELLLARTRQAERLLIDVERFFRSDWFVQLTDVDGERLLKRLEEEFE